MHPAPDPNVPVDANGNPIPLERIQPRRILGFMPNFRSVSGGAKPHPPGWKYNFTVATHQATDYSTFIFLGLTSLTAEGIDEHPALGKGTTDSTPTRGVDSSTRQTARISPPGFCLRSSMRTRAFTRSARVTTISYATLRHQPRGRCHTYGGRQTPNIAGLGGKVLTQVVSRYYYPTSATTFPVLAENSATP